MNADLSRANLSKAVFTNAKLSGANLSFSDLSSANFFNADLSNARLFYARLSNADLSTADLSRADLSRANLSNAKLSKANLSNANLSNANLCAVNFFMANLISVNLTSAKIKNAIVGYTSFSNLNLSTITGLDSVTHLGPSTIGIDTLFLSKGKIPEVFLRGAGVPDSFITYAKPLVASTIEFYSCFISYSHPDKRFARRLHDTLQGRGIRCWLDEKQLLPGDPLYDHIDRGIRLWDKFLLCCSEHSLQPSSWVDKEFLLLWRRRTS